MLRLLLLVLLLILAGIDGTIAGGTVPPVNSDMGCTGAGQALQYSGSVLTCGNVPAANVSGLAASATTDTTNAANISSGTLDTARGGAGTISGILKGNGSGSVSPATPGTDYAPATSGSTALKGNGSGGFGAAACGDLSNAAASCSTDATNASNITSGTLAAARIASGALGSGAEQTITYQPGLLTAINATQTAFVKFVKASAVDNMIGSASTFSCVSNPTITLTDTTTSTTIGTVTVTSVGAAFTGSINSSGIAAGDILAWAMTAGTCASIDIAANAQVHQN